MGQLQRRDEEVASGCGVRKVGLRCWELMRSSVNDIETENITVVVRCGLWGSCPYKI